jgi:uncharacterized protein (DUF1330 family)
MAYGYIIANVDVTDPQQYENYKRLSSAAIAAYGGEVLVRGGRCEVLEGSMQSRCVVIRFKDFETANAFYRSAEYSLAREARAGAARMNLIAVEGI